MIEKPAHRVYRGIAADHAGTNVRILVMDGGGGPTERKRATVLYELAPAEPFWWGYGGGSPGRTAAAIIEDTLPDALPNTLTDLTSELRSSLTVAFIEDFLSHCHDQSEFWLPARTIVRWIRAYFDELQRS